MGLNQHLDVVGVENAQSTLAGAEYTAGFGSILINGAPAFLGHKVAADAGSHICLPICALFPPCLTPDYERRIPLPKLGIRLAFPVFWEEAKVRVG
jgi:hypothetical protein